jgi:glutamate formiminotransferase/formiminotetrahydrofolate cyclodeaminase
MDTDALVVCVPNFSEGRDPRVIGAICEALASVQGARLVCRQADPEHNRLDTTIVGPPAAVRASAMAGAAKAVELIDMDRHSGGHPRMGAADVIPFVPLRSITMDEVVRLAREFARELAETLDLPVYLYERAALSPERRSLAEVRRGELEGLRDAVGRGERLPDFGPHRIGRAGATAVGARGALVAVSMNLVDLQTTGIRRAFDAVARLAAERGMQVRSSEIVGLVPRAALEPGIAEHVRLEGFDAHTQVLERLVNGEGVGTQTIEAFLERLASDAPTPGGGAVAALCGAAGAALVAMVCRLTIGRMGYEEADADMRKLLEDAEAARRVLLELADRDASAFDEVMVAFRMPKEDDRQRAERGAAIQRAYEGAARVPLDVARRAVALMEGARLSTELGNVNAASDGLSAAHVLHAAAHCALANVAINASGLKDEIVAVERRREADGLGARADGLLSLARAAFASRIG